MLLDFLLNLKYVFRHKKLKYSNHVVHTVQESVCANKRVIDLYVEIRSIKNVWSF